MNRDDVLEKWIPYRLQAIDTLQFAWSLINESEEPREVQVLIDGHLKIRGNVASIANPMIEAGVIHARAMLEFLGFCVRKGRLSQIKKRKPGDIAVEHFSTPLYPLAMAHPDQALAAYPGPRPEAEDALIAIFELANKSLAHVTDGKLSGEWNDRHVDIACRGIPVLIHNHLYAKLGRNIPRVPAAVPAGR